MKSTQSRFKVTIIIIIIAFSSTLVLSAKGKNVQSIYIREDGSIEPPTVPITRDEFTYTLTSDLINYFLYIQKTGITIDGAGHKLQGNKSGVTGILIYRENTTIKNLQVSQYGTAISLTSINNTIIGCTITQNTNSISMRSSTIQNIIGNSIIENILGISICGIPHFPGLEDNKISYNNLTNNDFGISIFRSTEKNIIQNNNIKDNYVGIELKESNYTIYANNFLRNSEQTRVDFYLDEDESPSYCTWDNSTAGNYWSDYTGTDSDGDGIGDISYRINQNNRDQYPLMNPLNNNYVFQSEPLPSPSPKPKPSPEPELPSTIVLASVIILAMISVGILAYYKKNKSRV